MDEIERHAEDPFDRVIERERRQRRTRIRKRARKAVKLHALIYVSVTAAFLVAWTVSIAMDGWTRPEFLPMAVGWGTGVAIHAAAVYRPWRKRRPQPAG